MKRAFRVIAFMYRESKLKILEQVLMEHKNWGAVVCDVAITTNTNDKNEIKKIRYRISFPFQKRLNLTNNLNCQFSDFVNKHTTSSTVAPTQLQKQKPTVLTLLIDHP